MTTNDLNKILIVCVVPVLVWIVSYIYLAIYHKKLNIFNTKIHESGKYTLLGTIFYFDHFIREIFIDTFYVLCIWWVYSRVGAEFLDISIWYLVAFLVFVFVGGYLKRGSEVFYDLFQFRELDHLKEWGSHWNMHFLSTLALMLIFIFPATNADAKLLIIFLAFFATSFVFKTNKKSLTDKAWLMHGAREIFTFIFTAFIPFYIVVSQLLRQEINIFKLETGIFIAIIGLYLVKIFKNSDIKKLSRGSLGYSNSALIASHFFEHFLDFIYMILLLGVLS